MDAAVVHRLGNPPRCEQFPEPVASDDEIVVHVLAASLKPVDKQIAGGSHYASPRDIPCYQQLRKARRCGLAVQLPNCRLIGHFACPESNVVLNRD
jgi:hypothetical protein